MKRVLLLESNHLLAGNITKFLAKRGYKVDHQVQPQAAISAADVRRPDAVIVDLFLAGRGGLEFLYEFRSYPDWLNVPAIIYSSLPLADLGESAAAMQHLLVQAFYYKPNTTLAELAASLDQALALTAT